MTELEKLKAEAERKHRDNVRRIMKRLRQTRQGETICLADWEVRELLLHIEETGGKKAVWV